MDNHKNDKGLYIIITILCILVLLLIGYIVCDKILFVSDDKIDINNENKIESFLVDSKFISTTEVLGSQTLEGYVFLSNGKFAYYYKDFYVRFNEGEDNRKISFVGTWSIENNKLILDVLKEEYAVGGTIINTPIGYYLSDYSKEVKDTNKTIEYQINGIFEMDHSSYLSLTLNNDEIMWYDLHGLGVCESILRELAENGYSNTYYELVK